MQDEFWHNSTLGCGADLEPWLRDHGSLTQRIQRRCSRFAVHNVYSGLSRIAHDESVLLDIEPRQLAYTREVFLFADDEPVVFAHSVLVRKQLRDAWLAVRTLGSKPLGAFLFVHPRIERMPLHYQALRSAHPLYRRSAEVLSNPPRRLWARRSLFYLHGAPLLVSEVFLPGILQLSNSMVQGEIRS